MSMADNRSEILRTVAQAHASNVTFSKVGVAAQCLLDGQMILLLDRYCIGLATSLRSSSSNLSLVSPSTEPDFISSTRAVSLSCPLGRLWCILPSVLTMYVRQVMFLNDGGRK
ncbi:hypothetical protein KC330_g30 [Hortaea werneckii]|nr:hypothetical protein KC330_g30 [Hortaea werneckii]